MKLVKHHSILVAEKVLRALKSWKHDAEISVHHWSNCREQGFALKNWENELQVNVAEARGSDEILILVGFISQFDLGTNQFMGEDWYPVAITSAAWGRYVEVPSGVVGQDEAGRLWDILWMLRLAARREGNEIRYTVYVRNDNRAPKAVTLKALCGPGDDAEPVITVMLPDED